MRPLRVLLIAALVAAVAVAGWAAWRDPDATAAGYTAHELGPVGPADRAMLYAVRQAGLWEMPVGEEAAQRASTRQFRDVAGKIAAEHHELDEKVRAAADTLGVTLPDEPTDDQQRWMRDISAASSGDYDRTAVQLLRAAHGKVLPVLASVRVGTRNAVVRDLADESTAYVSRHIAYLESTGLVDFSALPEPPPPTPGNQPAESSLWESRDPRTLTIAAAVGLLIVGALAALVVPTLRRRPGTPPPTPSPTSGSRHRRP